MAHLARPWRIPKHDSTDRRGRLLDGNSYADPFDVFFPTACIGVRLGRLRLVVFTAVESAGFLKHQPRNELGAVPRTFPVRVVLGHLNIAVFFTDVFARSLQQSGAGLCSRNDIDWRFRRQFIEVGISASKLE